MNFFNEDFMLRSKTAKKLYHKFAEGLPIIDYHCHISPAEIAEDHRFSGITELMLGGDHYKWRAMRSFGIEEKYVTGDAPDFDKFLAYATMLPHAIGNPLLHWTQLELKRYFGIDEMLTPESAKRIYDKANALLASDGYTARGLIARSNVEVICTTDDPADDLHWHRLIKGTGIKTRVLPAFRPDKAVNIRKDTFLPYIEKTGAKTYGELLEWLRGRIEFFHENGCRLSDHGLDYVPYAEGDAAPIFARALAGETISREDAEVYQTSVILFCAREYARRGWALQIHTGAIRNNNERAFAELGADAGFDSINDPKVSENINRLLNALDKTDELPKTILYSLNPNDNYTLATCMGNFQRAPYKSKIQLGSGWWFNDQRDGMEAQLRAFGNLGVLGCFVGMLTDSRSFVSYPRHEYFRRILCNLLGSFVENGEYPADFDALGKIVRGICYENAKAYFGF